MFKKILITSLLLLTISLTTVEAFEMTDSLQYGSVALREDSFRWKIMTDVGNPTLTSEVCFDDIKMIQWAIGSQVTYFNAFTIKGTMDYAYAYNKARGNGYDISLGLGYHLYAFDCLLKVTPLAGFSIERQSFKTCLERYSTTRDLDEDPNYFALLRTRYRAHWFGPWVGCDLNYSIDNAWQVFGQFAYHFTVLRGRGHTKYGEFDRDGFISRDILSHHAHGHGIDIGLGMRYSFCDNWFLSFGTLLEMRKITNGKQRGRHIFDDGISLADADPKSIDEINKIHNKLKLVEWRSLRLELALGYAF